MKENLEQNTENITRADMKDREEGVLLRKYET